ncbi:MAG: hypothetical protein RM021_004995 [Nostoc sp. EkiNYC01]|nr:hypothetical protein [Nostoc sp. EkiNYC01]
MNQSATVLDNRLAIAWCSIVWLENQGCDRNCIKSITRRNLIKFVTGV